MARYIAFGLTYAALLALVAAYNPSGVPPKSVSTFGRRSFLASVPVLTAGAGAAVAKGLNDDHPTLHQIPDYEIVEAQQATGDRLDLNNAGISEYTAFPGLYPRVAGKIASHGPYRAVKDVYKLDGLTSRDKEVLKKYEREFTVNMPGRGFGERINGRQST
mmetsp:Transcript_38771/g.105266  ORF Transcript_38771/g.105266 Transcript_38771/m.105266 type:complete len:161 (-) Transcript_38771:66-548(-)